ncbi:hypothetical protein CSTERTH_04415 [Thermoclostridium stercorarium subsp. thermolacticum DSM 2910]|uniref:Cell division protein DivIVA n=2 Tax=Thermoclostridium stercorarium TaxID=1510 RepID=A0A1B1YJC7_THEST|nr:DivIVA domain-containing protein [Thermoclostridium stercorarium]ANW98334.1 hypothetical protein CSTERTH_04415 [Thermoclostridium stercorarium subsp. thermolacticum DSM 2910]ANX00861.1 hypothetical protein CSTERLE_04320 [Thermoclostridium stercorarium subsp. leptospartum DSM 9219]
MAGSGAKKFGISLFGFKKSDVNAYLERVIREFDQRLKEKEEENARLKAELGELKEKYDKLFNEADSLMKEKEKIAGALLQAQEKAEMIIKEAHDRAFKEKMKLDQMLEAEKEKIVDIKLQLKQLKGHITDILSRYEKQMEEVITDIENCEKNYAHTGQEAEFNPKKNDEYEYIKEQGECAG